MTMTDRDPIDAELEGTPDFEALLSAEFRNRLGLDADDEPVSTDEDPAEGEQVSTEVAEEQDDDTFDGDDDAPVQDADDEDESPAPAASTPSAPAALTVPIPGSDRTFDLDVDTAQRLLGLAAWSENLAPQTREAFAAIETGAAVAISRADYERFAAWQQTQADRGDRFDDDDLDPRITERLARLESENAQLRAQPLAAQYSAQADQATTTFVDTAASYAAARGLSEDEMGRVFQTALNSGVIAQFAEQGRTYSPTGQLVRDADYADVARKAFDFAMLNDPQLRELAFQPAPTSGSHEPDPTAIKKARAGSLASAPSAAVTTPPVDVRQLSPMDRSKAMADELRAAMSGGA
jgi:hypothetical protein